jgi:hypothetical protein
MWPRKTSCCRRGNKTVPVTYYGLFMNAYGVMEVKLHFFLTSTPVGEWSESRLGRFTPGNHRIGSWSGPRAVWKHPRRESLLLLLGIELRSSSQYLSVYWVVTINPRLLLLPMNGWCTFGQPPDKKRVQNNYRRPYKFHNSSSQLWFKLSTCNAC